MSFECATFSFGIKVRARHTSSMAFSFHFESHTFLTISVRNLVVQVILLQKKL